VKACSPLNFASRLCSRIESAKATNCFLLMPPIPVEHVVLIIFSLRMRGALIDSARSSLGKEKEEPEAGELISVRQSLLTLASIVHVSLDYFASVKPPLTAIILPFC